MNYDNSQVVLKSAIHSFNLQVSSLNMLQSSMELEPALRQSLLAVVSSAIDLIKSAESMRQSE